MKADKSTIIRTIILLIALVNAVLEMFGIKAIPIEDETVSQAVSAVFLIVSAASAWWKNNSFTDNAIKADEYLKQLKGE